MAESVSHVIKTPAPWIMHVAHMPKLRDDTFWVYMISTTRTRDSIYRKPQEKVISRIRVDTNPLRHWLLSTHTHPQQAFFMLNCIMGPFASEAEAKKIMRVVSQGTRGSERRYAFMINWARAHRKRFLPLIMPATLICNPHFLPELLSSTANWGIVNDFYKNHNHSRKKKDRPHCRTKIE